MNTLRKIAYVLVIIGALNWGLWGFFKYNFVDSLFGGIGLATVIYMLVGLSGIMMLTSWGKK
jgi:uncharacterized protein